jgi:uncharacterized protein YqgC (DUF456 family)
MTWSHATTIFENGLGVMLFLCAQCVGILMEPFELPGLWLQFAAAVVLTLTTGLFGWAPCALILIIALCGEALGWLTKRLGMSKVKASKLAGWGAVIFGFVGAFCGLFVPFPIPLVGSMALSFLGTFCGAILGEIVAVRRVQPNLHVAFGAVLGRACAIAVKIALAFASAFWAALILALQLALSTG